MLRAKAKKFLVPVALFQMIIGVIDRPAKKQITLKGNC